jgi:formate/nitrite transporter FocA (FNT family)
MSSETDTEETRAYRGILEEEIENALREINRPTGGLFLSGIAAGLNVSFGALFMGMALTFSPGFQSALVRQLVLANVSAVGFIIVVLGGTELFTAHTAMGVIPVLDGDASVGELGRLWGVIYVGNLIGCTVFAGLIALIGPSLAVVSPGAFGTLADALLPFSGPTILLSGVVAGWLMGLVTWLVAAARDSVGEFLVTWVVTAGIGFGPFHHSLLGTTEVLGAMFLGQGVTPAAFAHFLLWTTLGNLVGGTVFVALLNYGQAVRGGTAPEFEVDSPE